MLPLAVVLSSLTFEPWKVVVHRHIHHSIVQCCVHCHVAVGKASGGRMDNPFSCAAEAVLFVTVLNTVHALHLQGGCWGHKCRSMINGRC
jgi:hypothetical protein